VVEVVERETRHVARLSSGRRRALYPSTGGDRVACAAVSPPRPRDHERCLDCRDGGLTARPGRDRPHVPPIARCGQGVGTRALAPAAGKNESRGRDASSIDPMVAAEELELIRRGARFGRPDEGLTRGRRTGGDGRDGDRLLGRLGVGVRVSCDACDSVESGRARLVPHEHREQRTQRDQPEDSERAGSPATVGLRLPRLRFEFLTQCPDERGLRGDVLCDRLPRRRRRLGELGAKLSSEVSIDEGELGADGTGRRNRREPCLASGGWAERVCTDDALGGGHGNGLRPPARVPYLVVRGMADPFGIGRARAVSIASDRPHRGAASQNGGLLDLGATGRSGHTSEPTGRRSLHQKSVDSPAYERFFRRCEGSKNAPAASVQRNSEAPMSGPEPTKRARPERSLPG
jgi:hypothetical protein